MEAPEVPLEAAQEHIHEHAHGHGGGEKARWILGVALSSALVAALAAVASLKAGHHANEALLNQIDANNQILKASDQWSYYQAKGVKAAVLKSKIDMLKALGKETSPADEAKSKQYEKDQEEITEKAHEFEKDAEVKKKEGEEHLEHHVGLAKSVTMFQICIAVSAISVLVNRRLFWFVSLGFAAIGVYAMAMGILK